MRKLILLLICVSTFSSCGLFKKVFKNKQLEISEVKTASKIDSTGIIIDKSIITVREKIDTAVYTKEIKVSEKVNFNVDSLISGMTAIKNDLVNVVIDYDPITKILKTTAILKPQRVDFDFERTTITQKDVSTSSKVQKVSKSETFDKKKSSEVKKEPAKMGIWLIAVIVVLIIVVGSIYYWFKKQTRIL